VIFHSLDFVAFFLLVVALYWRLPHTAQNGLIVVASYVFYGWVHPWFVLLVGGTTLLDYWAGRKMEDRPTRKRWYLGLSLAGNLGMLSFFKYFNFFLENVHAVLAAAGLEVSRPVLQIMLPVGVSFYTFQELSYTIDVYLGRLQARRNLLTFAAFVCFFPQLVAGPIERAARLLPQMEHQRHFTWEAARSATVLMVWGYFKKLVIADNVGVIANKVFSLADPSFPVLWAGVFAFAIQIYADFSAYSDIARGTARWLGIDLMTNFDHPYLARSPADFWRRWHISLSSWFRDYVYVPLGGSRNGSFITTRNILATFLLSGLWHGASWNYVLWGLYHGVLLVVNRALRSTPPRSAVTVPFRIAGTFGLTVVGWLFFRETETAALFRDLTLSPFAASALDWRAGLFLFLMSATYSVPIWIHGLWVELDGRQPEQPVERQPTVSRLTLEAVTCAVLVATVAIFRSRTSLDFIYFQF
jgi:D-alanyl-lipoteichoic acid acyltransferase DltB (MBOAT superfamily)